MNGTGKLTVHALEERGILQEIASLLDREDKANRVLYLIRFPQGSRPLYGSFSNSLTYWHEVCRLLEDGILGHEEDGLKALLAAVGKEFPGNELLRPWLPRQITPEPVPPKAFKGLVVELAWTEHQVEVDEVSAAMPVGLFRTRVLSEAAGRPMPARLLHLCNGSPAPLPLRATLAQAGVQDGDRFRLSRLEDEEDCGDTLHLLAEALTRFYSGRPRQIKVDAHLVGLDWMSERAQTETALVKALVERAAAKRGVLDLAILAAARSPHDAELRTALSRLIGYGAPGELAPRVWGLLKERQRTRLESVWWELQGSAQSSGNNSATRNPVSGS